MAGTIFHLAALLLAGLISTGANTISPVNYNIDLFIDTALDEFSGTVVIQAKVIEGGQTSFVLHNNGLNTSQIRVSQSGTEMFQSVSFDPEMQTMEINTVSGIVTSSQITITISYQGKISTDGTGLYTYLDNGNKIYMTNLYPIYARKLFPCLDDPGFGAPIGLTVTVPSTIGKFLASVDFTESKAKNGYQIFQLTTTPTIAPYSLFFTMGSWGGDFKLPVANATLWLSPSIKDNTDLIDPNLVNALTNPNISMIMALPGFAPPHLNIFITPVLKGESYSGLNTIVLKRDIVINDLVETTTEAQKLHLVKISYALYKMFFGTRVRPSNWGNNWLSDSISTYLAYHAIDSVPGYGTSDETLITDLDERVLRSTWAEGSSFPYMPDLPSTPNDILNFINSPGMEKGAFAIKTLETLFTKQQDSSTIINGLFNFCLSNDWKAVDTPLFIKTMSGLIKVNATGVSISEIIYPMISNSGYPLISLWRSDFTLTLTRTNFNYNSMIASSNGPVYSSGVASAASWLVPITSTTSNDPSKTPQVSIYYYSPNVTTPLFLNGSYDQNAWALLNVDGKGMLRVAYDGDSLMIFKQKANSTFTPASRAKIVSDTFAAAESGSISWVVALNFLEYLDQETDLAPWKVALDGFYRMWSWIYPTGLPSKDPKQVDLSTPFKAYISKRLDNLYSKLGTSGQSGDPSDPLRRQIVGAACEFGNKACVSDLAAQYQQMESRSFLPTNDMYSIVACNGLKAVKTINDWRKAYQTYINSGKSFSQQLDDSHFRILACAENNAFIEEFLKDILLGGGVKPFPLHQIKPAIDAIINNPKNIDQALNFFISNQAQFSPYINVALQIELLKALGDKLTVPSQYALLQGFAKNASLDPALVTAVNNSVAKAQQNINWIYSVQDAVVSGLNGGGLPSSTTSTSSTTSKPTGSTSSTTPRPTSTTTSKPGSASSLAVSAVTIALSIAFLALAQ